MEGQPQQAATQIDPDGLQAFYAEYGRLAFVAYQHEAKAAKLQQIGAQLLADHGPDKCVPVAAPADDEGAGG